jgi:hypothetical protein
MQQATSLLPPLFDMDSASAALRTTATEPQLRQSIPQQQRQRETTMLPTVRLDHHWAAASAVVGLTQPEKMLPAIRGAMLR